MANRTFGWIQNPGDLNALKRVVGMFVPSSRYTEEALNNKLPLLKKNNLITSENYKLFVDILSKNRIEIDYVIAKGKGVSAGESRSDALCSGVIQVILNGQKNRELIDLDGKKITIKKPYSDDWTTDGFLRWGISTGLIDYHNEKDSCSVSELGEKLVSTEDGSREEFELLGQALLSYPPVYRVLKLLSDHKEYTKFEIGNKLGFKGELGFTSIPQEVFVYDYCHAETSKERSDIRSNTEGDSDKYARMISNWLVKLGWLASTEKEVVETYLGETNTVTLQAWKITREGEKAIVKSDGNSSNPKIPKIVKFEMLASKISDCDYVRKRRALIIEALSKSDRTVDEIVRYLKTSDMEETQETIKDDINSFENIGINILFKANKYKLTDKIVGLKIPIESTTVVKGDVSKLKEKVRGKLKSIDHKYLVLLDLAYSDASTKARKNLDAKQFEIETANLFSKELDYRAERLGDSSKPDVLIEYSSYGAIVDNKSYKDGFNIAGNTRDEMARYVEENKLRQQNIPPNEWWKWFDVKTSDFRFLFITSYLKGNFKNSIEYIYNTKGVKGGAINVENLLYLAENIKSGTMDKEDFFKIIDNDEVISN